ncbi:MAG: LPS assembly lipoprotein LptE [Deltaproteobacteria bacterium]|jgi:hypothetical protein|nr:LPS assembly lipoprotein LptE [Deltaproteobacteria bacterium]
MLWLPEFSRMFSAKRTLLLLCLLLAAVSGGCGYAPAGGAPSVMGGREATLTLVSIEQPTVFPWVNYTLRSSLRDEIASRNLAVWVDEGEADYSLRLRVEALTMRSSVRSRLDAPLLYSGSVTISAVLYRRGSDNNGREAWRTRVSYSDTFESGDEENAARLLFAQAARLLADRMRHTF